MAVSVIRIGEGVRCSSERRTCPDSHPQAGMLRRSEGNPILKPVTRHRWESRYVLNAAAVKLEGRVYLLYRAYGEEGVSRIGLAVSDDGLELGTRLEAPIFEPGHQSESRGCEDPRVTVIGERLYMAYTAYDGVTAQIALASIEVDRFLEFRWQDWRRHGLFRSGVSDKDAAVFPMRFGSRFGMVHRIDPDIWITFAGDLQCPWPDHDDRVLASPGKAMAWDGLKIGAGAQPIETEFGWLLITHGVDRQNVYRLGVMVLDRDDPSHLIYRSPNPVLEPVAECEVGGREGHWVPNVVFTCGAVPANGGENPLGADAELMVYYGGADSVINVATATVGDLIPEAVRMTHRAKTSGSRLWGWRVRIGSSADGRLFILRIDWKATSNPSYN